MAVSNKMKELRAERQLSVAECAQFIGVSPSTYRDWENGRSISGEPYIDISRLFGVSLSELFGFQQTETLVKLSRVERDINELLQSVRNIKLGL